MATLGELWAQGRFRVEEEKGEERGGEEGISLGSRDEGQRMIAFMQHHPLMSQRVARSNTPEDELQSLVQEMKKIRKLIRAQAQHDTSKTHGEEEEREEKGEISGEDTENTSPHNSKKKRDTKK